MNILIIGSGGREHALALAISKSPLLTKLYVAPGNPGTATLAQNTALDQADHRGIIAFCHRMQIALVGSDIHWIRGGQLLTDLFVFIKLFDIVRRRNKCNDQGLAGHRRTGPAMAMAMEPGVRIELTTSSLQVLVRAPPTGSPAP